MATEHVPSTKTTLSSSLCFFIGPTPGSFEISEAFDGLVQLGRLERTDLLIHSYAHRNFISHWRLSQSENPAEFTLFHNGFCAVVPRHSHMLGRQSRKLIVRTQCGHERAPDLAKRL